MHATSAIAALLDPFAASQGGVPGVGAVSGLGAPADGLVQKTGDETTADGGQFGDALAAAMAAALSVQPNVQSRASAATPTAEGETGEAVAPAKAAPSPLAFAPMMLDVEAAQAPASPETPSIADAATAFAAPVASAEAAATDAPLAQAASAAPAPAQGAVAAAPSLPAAKAPPARPDMAPAAAPATPETAPAIPSAAVAAPVADAASQTAQPQAPAPTQPQLAAAAPARAPATPAAPALPAADQPVAPAPQAATGPQAPAPAATTAPAADAAPVMAAATQPAASTSPTVQVAQAAATQAAPAKAAPATPEAGVRTAKGKTAAATPVEARNAPEAASSKVGTQLQAAVAAKAEDDLTLPAADDASTPADTDIERPTLAAASPAHAETRAVQSAPVETPRATPQTVALLAAQIAHKVEGKSTRFDVQLDPHGLGKVDVRVEISARGEVSAALTFENPQAASELRGRAGELQTALEQAGFDLSKTSLSFNSGGQGQHQGLFDQQQQNQTPVWRGRAFADLSDTPETAPAPVQRRAAAGGVDVRI